MVGSIRRGITWVVAYFVGEAHSGVVGPPEQLWRRRIVVLTALIVGALSVPMIVAAAVTLGPLSPTPLVLLGGATLVFLVPLLVRRSEDHRLGGTVLSILLLVGVGVLSILNGGLVAAATIWQVPIPFIAAVLVGPRFGLVCAGVVVVEGVLVFTYQSLGGHLPRPYGHVAEQVWRLAALASAGLAVGFMGWLVYRERARAEAAKDRSRRDFARLFEAIPDLIMVLDEGVIRYLNPAAAKSLGLARPGRASGRRLVDFVAEGQRDDLERFILREAQEVSEVTLVGLDQKGVVVEPAPLQTALFQGKDMDLFVARDVTERKEMMAQLVLTDRLASLGMLAAGVAHEINNPLTFVMGNLSLLASELEAHTSAPPAPALWQELTSDACEGARRVAEIVKDLGQFSRSDLAEPGRCDLSRIIDRAGKMAGHQVRRRATLRTEVEGPLLLTGHEGRLTQVFVNLIANGAQAIEPGATSANEVLVSAHTADGQITVEVTDTGCGIPPDVQARLFEPFFTTKPVGEGTGLGLAISQAIIVEHGGQLTVSSDVGRGSTFRVTLPLAAEMPTGVDIHRGQADATVGRRRQILVADDEPRILEWIRRTLRDHDLTTVGDGSSAIQLLRRREFDLVLCDLAMPGADGLAVYEAAREHRPALTDRFVFITGCGMGDPLRQGLRSTGAEIVEKPLTAGSLREVVERSFSRGLPA